MTSLTFLLGALGVVFWVIGTMIDGKVATWAPFFLVILGIVFLLVGAIIALVTTIESLA